MKAAAAAFALAAVFLAAVLTGGGQRQATRESPPSPIQVRQTWPAGARSTPSASPSMQEVKRHVDSRRLDDYDDHGDDHGGDDHSGRHGGDDDNSGPGSVDDNSGPGSVDDNSGPGSVDDNSGPGSSDD